jgi:hypothetical protein
MAIVRRRQSNHASEAIRKVSKWLWEVADPVCSECEPLRWRLWR